MVAASKRKSHLLWLKLLILSVAITHALTAEAGAKLAELGIANQHLARALVNLEKQASLCDAAVQVIPKSAFEELDVPVEHLQTAFLYFFVKASNDCLREAAGEYLIAIALYNHFSDGITPPSGEPVDMNFLVMMNIIREIEREKEYLALPRSSRQKLESVEEFSKPFDPFLSAENAGLIKPRLPENQ